MPTTVNGIGTQYYGSQNVEKEAGICEHCGQETTLSNYETGYWFVILFIPIIPLGKKKILNDCANCRQHYAIPLDEWERIEDESLDAATDKLAENRNDPDSALELFGNLVAFNKKEEATQLAETMAVKFSNNADVQMNVGAWLEKLGRTQEADDCFQKAFEIAPDDPGPRRAMGVDKLQKGNPEEAAELLATFRHPSEYYDPILFFMLAAGFQEKGKHERALDEYETLAETHSDLLKESGFREQVLISEEALGISTEDSMLPKFYIYESSVFWLVLIGCIIAAVIIFLTYFT